MNSKYFGDSYDIVKRFFCNELTTLGYVVAVRPMFTCEWKVKVDPGPFFKFVCAEREFNTPKKTSSALLIDPDTGVGKESSARHVVIRDVVNATQEYELVFVFDQSFSRQTDAKKAMRKKLVALKRSGCEGMYYNSHARFLFASCDCAHLKQVRDHLLSLGLPSSRFVFGRATNLDALGT